MKYEEFESLMEEIVALENRKVSVGISTWLDFTFNLDNCTDTIKDYLNFFLGVHNIKTKTKIMDIEDKTVTTETFKYKGTEMSTYESKDA